MLIKAQNIYKFPFNSPKNSFFHIIICSINIFSSKVIIFKKESPTKKEKSEERLRWREIAFLLFP
jgi:hypothetical protein